LQYFNQYQERLSKLIGPQEAKRLVNNGIILITLGGNDFVNNYYLVPYSARSREFALPDYIRYVISEYKKILVVCNSFSVMIVKLLLINYVRNTDVPHKTPNKRELVKTKIHYAIF
jgi:hypothetical protein